MKKSVTIVVVIVLLSLGFFTMKNFSATTGRVIDFPAPPPAPAFGDDGNGGDGGNGNGNGGGNGDAPQPPGTPPEDDGTGAPEPPGTPPETDVCGNGVLESGEECDDGNTFNNDGCSSVCTNEQQPPEEQVPGGLTEEEVESLIESYLDDVPSVEYRADESTAERVREILSRLDALEFKAQVLDFLPELEERVIALEARTGDLDSRLGQVESRLSAAEQEMRARPEPQIPFDLNDIEDMIGRKTALGTIISTIALVLLVGLVAVAVVHRRHMLEEDKELIQQYLRNYANAGYDVEMLKMHLRASGWEDEMIEKALEEMQR